jgi:GNAT superfamily N-acetyltransferase
MMGSDRVRVWIAETVAGECAVGYAVAVSDEDTKLFSSFELKRLYIFYRFQGKGLGRRLMEDVMSFAKQLKSETICFKFMKPTLMPSNSTNALVLSRPGLICFRPAKVLTGF